MIRTNAFLVLIAATLFTLSAAAQPNVIAHRGFWKTDGSAQNSLTSLRKADSLGVYGSECDVWMTVDGKLVVNHDRTYQGVEMEKSPAKEILAVELPNGEKIPTFRQYLKTLKRLPNVRLIVEIKSRERPEAARAIAREILKQKLQDRVEIIAWTVEPTREAMKLLPGVDFYYLSGNLTPDEVKAAGFQGIDYSDKVLRKHPEWIRQAQELGLKVNVWTPSAQKSIEEFIELGVDFITTDRPDLALRLVEPR